jgi:hypothetical protein
MPSSGKIEWLRPLALAWLARFGGGSFSDLDAAQILFLANASAFDAIIGCFDAKYHY